MAAPLGRRVTHAANTLWKYGQFAKVTPTIRPQSTANISNLTDLFQSSLVLQHTPSCTQARHLHTSNRRQDLKEFFDDKEHWAESKINTGRPWMMEELRIKSNSDLHKLWYVLLKERNMLMTMEEEYNRELEIFPAPERIDKVEESMENLLLVLDERDEAVVALETGETDIKAPVWRKNVLNMWQLMPKKEHLVPKHKNPTYLKGLKYNPQWMVKYKKLYREKQISKHMKQKVARMKREKFVEHLYSKSDSSS